MEFLLTILMLAVLFGISGFITYLIAIRPLRNGAKRKYANNSQSVQNNRIQLESLLNQTTALRNELYPKYIFCLIMTIIGTLCATMFPVIGSTLEIEVIQELPALAWVVLYIIFFGLILYGALSMDSMTRKYNDNFNYYVLPNIIKSYNSDLAYRKVGYFGKEEYLSCKFFEMCDYFTSSDGIIDKNSEFVWSDIKATPAEDGGDNNTGNFLGYTGSLARMTIPDCKCEVLLGSLKQGGLFKTIKLIPSEYSKINFESEEFNQLFTAYASNELLAYKVITPEVMEQFIHLRKNTFGDIDIRIIRDHLYIRFKTGNGFVPSLLSKTKEDNSIIVSITLLDEIINVTKTIKKLLEKKI